MKINKPADCISPSSRWSCAVRYNKLLVDWNNTHANRSNPNFFAEQLHPRMVAVHKMRNDAIEENRLDTFWGPTIPDHIKKSKNENFGTGDDVVLVFGGTSENKPIENTLTVSVGGVTGADDGAGNIIGTGISGSIDYLTGDYTITFDVAPSGTVSADYEYYSVKYPPGLNQSNEGSRAAFLQALEKKLQDTGEYDQDHPIMLDLEAQKAQSKVDAERSKVDGGFWDVSVDDIVSE